MAPWRTLGLLYTPTAMVVAQALIATPIVAGLSLAAVGALNPRYRLQLLALGASRWQSIWWLLREARLPLIAAVVAGFGAVISEVGAAMMVGGNIKGETRVLTTATVLEVSRGHFETAFALSFVLLGLTYLVTMALTLLQRQSATRARGDSPRPETASDQRPRGRSHPSRHATNLTSRRRGIDRADRAKRRGQDDLPARCRSAAPAGLRRGHSSRAARATPANARTLRRSISVVFQDPLLFNVRVLSNAAAGPSLPGGRTAEANRAPAPG